MSDVNAALALRQDHITFLAASTNGQVYFGTQAGATYAVSAAASTSTGSEPVQTQLPKGYALTQNYPNPFNPVTTIGSRYRRQAASS